MDLTLVLGALALVVAAVLVFWRQPVFAFVQRSAGYLREVRGEIMKVSWPGRVDLRKSTVVIIIFILVIGMIIGIMDWLLSLLLIDLLGQAFR